MDEAALFKDAEDRMKKVIEAFQKSLASIRAGRANPMLLDKVTVDYYGVPTPINQVANIGVAPPRTLVVQPWDKGMLPVVEKALQRADLGAMPVNDGTVVRITLPQLSRERRKEIIKAVGKDGEAQKVAVRNIRRDINGEIKKAEKDKLTSEDDARKMQDRVQELTDKYIKVVDDLVEAKEKEILEV